MRRVPVLLLLLLACAPQLLSAFYLPGVAPRSYEQVPLRAHLPHRAHASKDEPVPLLVNRLDSPDSLVPFDYYSYEKLY